MQPMAVIKSLVTIAVATLTVSLAAQALAATITVRYGPYTIPAGTMDAPGVIHNKLSFTVRPPCLDCSVPSFAPDLVSPDGRRATMKTGAMLHPIILASRFRSDATCNAPLRLAGERLF